MKLFLVAILLLICSRSCTSLSKCECITSSGGYITLSHLDSGDPSKPKFSSIVTPDGTIDYSYNPCTGFMCGSFNGSAVCSLNMSSNVLTNVGTQENATCIPGLLNDIALVYYTDSAVTTKVQLICDSNETTGKLTAANFNGSIHNLELRSLFCCPQAVPIEPTTLPYHTVAPNPPSSSLSAGSVLLIVFFSLLLAYLVFGILFRACVVGARGYEVIPHYEFWSSLPGLIQDGCVFIMQLILGGSVSASRAGYSEISSPDVPARGGQSYQPPQQNPQV